MATDYELSAVHGVNRYLWEKIKTEKVWDLGTTPAASRYANNWTPIIPTQQLPEFNAMIDAGDNAGGVPFIIYNWTTVPGTGTQWWLETDNIVYLVYSQSEAEIRKVSNLMKDIFKKQDQAGQAVTDYVKTLGSAKLNVFDYKNINITSSGGPLPMENEGGRLEAVATIRVTYTVNR